MGIYVYACMTRCGCDCARQNAEAGEVCTGWWMGDGREKFLTTLLEADTGEEFLLTLAGGLVWKFPVSRPFHYDSL